MKKRWIAALLLLLLLSAQARAQVSFPEYTSFAQERAGEAQYAENPETATLQCLTDEQTLDAYREELAACSLYLSGTYELPDSEYYTRGVIYTYVYLGEETPEPFTMAVREQDVLCHLLLQVYDLPDGQTLLAMTWSRDLSAGTVPEPTPVPEPTQEPRARYGHWDYVEREVTCWRCHGSGKCQLCHGTGTYSAYGQSISCRKDCDVCGGTGKTTQYDKVWVWDDN